MQRNLNTDKNILFIWLVIVCNRRDYVTKKINRKKNCIPIAYVNECVKVS